MGKENKSCYTSQFIKKGYFIPALFFAVLFSFIFIMCYEYQMVKQLSATIEHYFILGVLGYFAIILFVYLFVSAKSKKLVFGDSITIGIFFATIIYTIYLTVVCKDFGLFRLISCGTFFLISLAFIIIAIVRFNPSKEREIFYTKNNLNGYYHVIFKKFGFLGTYLTAFALTCFSYALIKIKLPTTRGKDVFMYACGIFIALFLIFKTCKKKIDLFDAGVLSATISIPPIFVLSVFSTGYKFSSIYFYGFVVYFLLTVFFLIIRLLTFDNSPIKIKEHPIIEKRPLLNFFFKFSEKFGFLFSLASASILALVTQVLLRYDNFETIRFIIDRRVTTYLIFPVYYCVILLFGTFVLGSVLALINIKAKKITIGDTFNVISIFYSLLCFLLSVGVSPLIYPLFFGLALFCHLVVFVARVKHFSQYVK